MKKELKFLSSIRRKTAAFDSEEREFLMGLGHYKVCINIYPAGEYDSRVKAMLCLPKKAARKSPQVHPPFYPPALILVFASQIPVPPLMKKTPSVAKETQRAGNWQGLALLKRATGRQFESRLEMDGLGHALRRQKPRLAARRSRVACKGG